MSNVDSENPAAFVMIEEFKDAQAFQFHSQQPYLMKLLSVLDDFAIKVDIATYTKN